jgi:predicted dehydrogenase
MNLLRAIDAGRDPEPSFAAGLDIQRVLAAAQKSSDQGNWQVIDR